MEMTLAEELRLNKLSNVVKISAIIILFIIAYYHTFLDLNAKYSEVDSYYSHGYLIPFISAYIIWLKRNKLGTMSVVPSRIGLLVFVLGLLVYLFARAWYVNVIANASMIVVLGGLCLYLFGKKITRELVFPLLFLLFMIPLPKISIIYVTFWLKLFAAAAATKIISFMGIPAVVKGALIFLPQGLSLEVENACSGLRSLISLIALGVAYAYFLKVSLFKKYIFCLTALPIATVANVIRIISDTLIFYIWEPPSDVFKHIDTINGFLAFAIAFVGLYLMGRVITSWEECKSDISTS